MRAAWWFALGRLAGVLAVAVAGGLIFGRLGLWLVAVLAGYLALQLVNLYRVERWLRHRSEESPPDLGGVWGNLVALVGGLHRRKKFHKQRVTRVFAEFRRLAAALPDGVVLLTPSLEILWFNRTAGRLLRLRRKADLGVRVDNLVRQPEFARYVAGAVHSAPVVLRWAQPEERYLACHLIAAGQQRLLLVRDVTREVLLETMRKDFVANASHELRSPLTVVSGYLDQMAEDIPQNAAWRAPVAEMQRQAERMRHVVQDLLELSRLEASGGEAALTPLDVAGLLARVRDEALAGAGGRRNLYVDVDSRATLLGSEAEVHSIAANLVSNAVKYTAEDGTVRIRWWTDGQGGHLAVADDGVGIDAEHLPRLTERFYRADAGRARAAGGSGLGLSIVKHALQRHGGRLEVESTPGRGSTFTAHFPLRRVGNAGGAPRA